MRDASSPREAISTLFDLEGKNLSAEKVVNLCQLSSSDFIQNHVPFWFVIWQMRLNLFSF